MSPHKRSIIFSLSTPIFTASVSVTRSTLTTQPCNKPLPNPTMPALKVICTSPIRASSYLSMKTFKSSTALRKRDYMSSSYISQGCFGPPSTDKRILTHTAKDQHNTIEPNTPNEPRNSNEILMRCIQLHSPIHRASNSFAFTVFENHVQVIDELHQIDEIRKGYVTPPPHHPHPNKSVTLVAAPLSFSSPLYSSSPLGTIFSS